MNKLTGLNNIHYCHPYHEVAAMCHKVKDGLATDYDLLEIAYEIDVILPADAVLIPIPGHDGRANENLKICQYTQRPYWDFLRMRPTKTTWYERKQTEGPVVSRKSLPYIYREKRWCLSKMPPLNFVLIDVVCGTGTTIRQARKPFDIFYPAYVWAYDTNEPTIKTY